VAWRHDEGRRLEKQIEPRLHLVFRPDLGDPFMLEKRQDNDRVKGIYRVGLVNPTAVSVEDVAVLVKSWQPSGNRFPARSARGGTVAWWPVTNEPAKAGPHESG